ncbi:MAG: hypothetical protein Q4B68_04575 [Bacteroidales bacterium]|nr:hypothetical protein [Bacteroidales bacterium]
MSFKEVNALRKNGQLAEAHEMALADLQQEKSSWTYSALFWVLNDKCKLAIEQGQTEEAEALVEEMDSIQPELNDTDGIAQKCITSLQNKLMPRVRKAKEAEEMSKNPEQVDKAFEILATLHADGELDDKFLTPFGWVIYRYIKKHQGNKNQVVPVKKALNTYMGLDLPRPSLLHSSILRMAIDLEKHFKEDFKFTKFLEMWGLENFTDDDWKQGEGENGIKFPSTVENAICKYSAELKDDNISNVPDEYVALLDKAFARYHKPLYSYYKAKILAKNGHSEEALNIYRKLVPTMGQGFLWNDIANIIGDPKLKKAAICKGIISQREERFLGGSHLRLAAILLKENAFAEALHELNAYKAICERNNFHLKYEYGNLCRLVPANTTPSPDNRRLYQQCANDIEEFIYADSPVKLLVLSSVFESNGRERARLVSNTGESVTVNARQLRRQRDNSYQPFYTARVVDVDGKKKVVGMRATSPDEAVRNFSLLPIEGPVRIRKNQQGKHFGFVDDCYVNGNHLDGITDGQHIKVYAITKPDGKKQALAIAK